MSNNNYALGESAAGIISPISETATEHPPNGGAEHGALGDDALRATGAGSLRPCDNCLHALEPGMSRDGCHVISFYVKC